MKIPMGEEQGDESKNDWMANNGSDESKPIEFLRRNMTYTKEEALVVDGINGRTYDAAVIRLALGCVHCSRMFSKYDWVAKEEYNSDTGIPLKGGLIETMGRTLYEDLLAAGLIVWCGDPLESSIGLTLMGMDMLATLVDCKTCFDG